MTIVNLSLRAIGLVLCMVIFCIFEVGCSRTSGQGSGQKNSTQKNQANVDRTFEPFLAHDAKTGEYLGVVISECRDWETKKVTSYKVRLKDRTVVEKSPDSITIDPP